MELLAGLALFGFALGMAALYLRAMESPLNAGVSLVEGRLRHARAAAIATTSAYRLRSFGTEQVVGEFAANCAAGSWTVDPAMQLDLPREVDFTGGAWQVCYGGDGKSSDNVTIGLWHPELGGKQVEVMRGGTTRILP